MASQGSHQSLNVGIAIEYNMMLEYHIENALKAKIYVDPLGQFAMRIDDHEKKFFQETPVSIQGDMYMNPYATMYLIVDDPQGANP